MSSDNKLSDKQCEGVSEPLGTKAFIVVDKANCLYKPDVHSAVRVVPPYGTAVSIVRDQGSWVLIRYCGKEAWSPRRNLSTNLAPPRPAEDVGVVPLPSCSLRSPRTHRASAFSVEYGPRGGRFVRTSSGFRRYF